MLANILAITALICTTTLAAEVRTMKDDEVATLNALPGWPNKTTFGMYSGFINIENTTKDIHYVFLESQTNNTTEDPIVIWFNGGPGCSSMLGFLQETGPYVLMDDSSNYTENPYSWNKETNILYIEQPAGVGYSTCDNEVAPQDCNHTDVSSSEDNLKVLLGWLDRFKEKKDYRKNEIFISGESYGGIYVPYFAHQINEYNKAQATPDTKINLQGFFVGNGVSNWTYDTFPATVDQMYYRSMISNEVMANIEKADCNFSGVAIGDYSNFSAECGSYLNTALKSLDGVNIYNLYGPCWNYNASANATNFTAADVRNQLYGKKVINGVEHEYQKFISPHEYTPWLPRIGKKQLGEDYGIPGCIWALPAAEQLNTAAVMSQLNINKTVVWRMCSNANSTFSYQMNASASQWAYEELKGQIRMAHYTGDMDGSVPTIGTERWINGLGWEVKSKWQPFWEYGQVAGYHQTFFQEAWEKGLTLITVHGAGHMVPQDQRSRAYQILFNWVFKRGEFKAPSSEPAQEEPEILQF